MDIPLEKSNKVFIKRLYPQLTDKELQEAEENLDRYLELSLRVWRKIRDTPTEGKIPRDLTVLQYSAKIAPDKA